MDDEAGLLDMLKITLKKERFTDKTCAYTAKEVLNLNRLSISVKNLCPFWFQLIPLIVF
ncbi:hypothetical protein [Faecalispora sporosphaeroides]|uniref:hypothetical protein n=1 Tax=Faecalispora sporosphaeroides TaxID=1549 RepID=UPI0012B54AB5|nr:hypothetical protein [Faecalispora sporosphaeroides]